MLKPIYTGNSSNSSASKPIYVNVGVGKGSGKSVIPDWNQNDPTANDYIKNRPCFSQDSQSEVYLEETVIPASSSDIITVPELPDPNCTYIVTCNGVEYECIPVLDDETQSTSPVCFLGNLNLLNSSFPNTREPFLILFFYTKDAITLEFKFKDASIDNTISIDKVTTPVKLLDTVLSKRIINLTRNPYVLYYFGGSAQYACIDTNLSIFDLLNAIVAYGQYVADCVGRAEVLQNKLVAFSAWNDDYLYNPYSGYVSFRNNWDSINAYDISSIVEVEDVNYFLDATLQYKDGDPVICNFVKYNDDDAEVVLVAAEPVLKDSSGNTIHDFTIGPIIYNRDTHGFIYGDTSWPTV